MKTIGQILRKLRLQADKQQHELAALLGIEQQAYSKFERDERTPKLEYLQKIAAFYQIPISHFFSDLPSQENDKSIISKEHHFAITLNERELYEKLLESKDAQVNY
jgi:transcriptional regulator with XRE-family HTH domain